MQTEVPVTTPYKFLPQKDPKTFCIKVPQTFAFKTLNVINLYLKICNVPFFHAYWELATTQKRGSKEIVGIENL
jgi:hypothetical protein